MYCRACKTPAPPSGPASPTERGRVARIWGADRISGLRCARCGNLLGAEDIAQLLGEKASQLEQFGLLSPRADVPAPNPASHSGMRAIRLWKG